MTISHRLTNLLTLASLVVLAGCFSLSRDAPPVEHYVLSTTDAPEVRQEAPAGAPTIGLRQVQLAEYLDIPFIVIRRGPNRITYSDFHRWGEGLSGGISRAVARDLESRGVFGGVDAAPWPAGVRPDYIVQIHVTRFEGLAVEDDQAASGSIHISATWNALRSDGGEVVARGRIDRRQSAWQVGDYASLLAAFEQGLSELGDDISERLTAVTVSD